MTRHIPKTDDIDAMSEEELDAALLEEKRRQLRSIRDENSGKVEIGLSPELMKQQKLITRFVLTILGVVFGAIILIGFLSFLGEVIP